MLPSRQPDAAVEALLPHLEAARWIRGHVFRKGMGYILNWTTSGYEHAGLLRELVQEHRLAEGRRAWTYTLVCEGKADAAGFGKFSLVEAEFWISCVQELGLQADGEEIRTLCAMIARWRPRSAEDNDRSDWKR